MTFQMRLNPASMKVLERALAQFAPEVLVDEVKPIIQEANKDIKRDAVANLRSNNSKRSGALIRGVKIGAVQRSRKRGLFWAATGVKSSDESWRGKKIDPAKYSGLVERGHISRRGFVPGKPYVRPAAEQNVPKCLANVIARLKAILSRGAA